MKWIAMLFVLALHGDVAPARRAFDEGRFGDAVVAYGELIADDPNGVAAATLANLALAAYHARAFDIAELSAERAAVRGGKDYEERRDFLLGAVAFARYLKAEAATFGPRVTPADYDRAIRAAEAAVSWWAGAAMRRADWPEARRNAERAWIKAQAMRRRKAAAEEEARKMRKEEGREEEPPPDPNREIEELPIAAQTQELGADQVRRLLDTLRLKQREKVSVRRAVERARPAAGGRDW